MSRDRIPDEQVKDTRMRSGIFSSTQNFVSVTTV